MSDIITYPQGVDLTDGYKEHTENDDGLLHISLSLLPGLETTQQLKPCLIQGMVSSVFPSTGVVWSAT